MIDITGNAATVVLLRDERVCLGGNDFLTSSLRRFIVTDLKCSASKKEVCYAEVKVLKILGSATDSCFLNKR